MLAAVLIPATFLKKNFFFRKMNFWRDRTMIDVQLCDKASVTKY